MPKIHSIYHGASLIECPDRWSYYKEGGCGPLIIMESEKKHPGKFFFVYGSLNSSIITDIKMHSTKTKEYMIAEIFTHEGEHVYKFRIRYDS